MGSPQRTAVIIPTCDRQDWLAEAVASLLAQTRPPDEILVVADGSPDAALHVLAPFKDSIRILRQVHAGRSAARNAGLRASTADLIAFLDDDDRLPPDSLALRTAYLETHPDVDVVYGETETIDAAGQRLGPFRRLNRNRVSGSVLAEIALQNLAPIHAVMFRRSCFERVGGFDEQLDSAEDWDLWIRFAAQFRFAHINACVAEYRLHAGMSSASDADRLARNTARVQSRVFAMPAFQQLMPGEQARLFVRYGLQNFRIGALDESRRAFAQALHAQPTRWAAYPLLLAVALLGTPLYRLTRAPLVQNGLQARRFR